MKVGPKVLAFWGLLQPAQRSIARMILFSALSACDCLFVRMSVSTTAELLEIVSQNFQGIVLWSKG